MPTVTQHAPGTFCWPECATTDPAAAKAFYASLFDWTWQDIPMGDAGAYHIASRGGREAAAMHALTPEMRAQGVPPCWTSYVAVASADEAAKKAEALGGRVLNGPFDVMENGRMAVLMDPIGATFCVWQPKTHNGIGVHGEPGSLGWTQLNAKEPEKAKPFYSSLLGWTYRDDPMGPGMVYTTWMKSDGIAGGMMPMPPGVPDSAPSHWLVYWAVRDVAESHAKSLSLGATSAVAPTEIPGMGHFSVLCDPQGATFALVAFTGM